MTREIGDKEKQNRAMREARFKSAKLPSMAPIKELREKVSKIPAKKSPKAKKARR